LIGGTTRLLIALAILPISTVNAQREYPEIPPYEERGYDYAFTFKYGQSYTRDPWVWGYTQEFAERFDMPKQWIEPELKGILAVAFRMNKVGNDTCGLGGRAENCWPHLECQMDIYYDTAIDHKLPWNRPDIMQDFFMSGVSSQQFVDWQLRRKLRMEKYLNRGGTGVGFGLSINDQNTRYFSFVRYYNRQILPGVGLIGVEGGSVCPYEVGPAIGLIIEHLIVGKEAEERVNNAYKHEVFLPESYMRRAHEAYERDKKPNEAIKQKLIQNFINRHPPQK
jgi:hypothetical protein